MTVTASMPFSVRTCQLSNGDRLPLLCREGLPCYETTDWILNSLWQEGNASNTMALKLRAIGHWLRWAEQRDLTWEKRVQTGVFFTQDEITSVLTWMGLPIGTPPGVKVGRLKVADNVRRGPAGITAINAAMHGLCATGKATWSGLATGDPVIHLENDYDALVWNGSLGVVEEALPDGARILWDDHEKGITYREDRREALDLAYAISVHKAQGSQFKRVIVPVFPSRILDRTLIYTALTRATEQVVFIGDRSALEAAVAAPPAPHRRRTGMVA